MSHPRKHRTIAIVLDDAVRETVVAAYRRNGWNTTHAAKALGICRRTLLRWVSKHRLRIQIDREREQARK